MKPDGCGSCAAYVHWALRGGHLSPLRGSTLLYNDVDNDPAKRQYLDPATCFYVNASGAKVQKWNQLRIDGEVCPDCPKPPPAMPCPPTSPSPPPSPPGEAPPIDPTTGNYPMPPDLVCPPWFKDALARVGIHVAGMVPCQQGNVCRRVTLWATQKSAPPFCPHAPDRRECEMWRACQEPQFVDYHGGDPENPGGGIVMQIAHPDWGNVWGRLDKQTCDPRHDACPPGMTNPVHNFNGHDKAVDRGGVTRARACMPDGTKCSETTYRTDQ